MLAKKCMSAFRTYLLRLFGSFESNFRVKSSSLHCTGQYNNKNKYDGGGGQFLPLAPWMYKNTLLQIFSTVSCPLCAAMFHI
jgi:hypothetical protein